MRESKVEESVKRSTEGHRSMLLRINESTNSGFLNYLYVKIKNRFGWYRILLNTNPRLLLLVILRGQRI